ncbi:MAG TPA: class I SAM-dependent methyltransferase, partial [candidate division Zixibacteria bacterium]|nr:class I SAM-dependent methyltransferase [candidate division Zixibacteria bacterium]
MLTLKAGRENAPANRHPWIFSGALAEGKPEVPYGALVRVAEASGQVIATGTYSAKGMIAVRVLAWEEAPITREWIRERVREAVERRRLVGIGADETVTGYRAVFGEADGLPGLVVDRYGEVAVVQFATAGAEGLREPILQALADVLTPAAIYERSDLPARTEEGLAPASGLLSGVLPERVEFAEHGLRFTADVTGGQKTGFFLDQRDVRRQARALAAGRRVADLFSYRGAAGVAALKGGAEHVHCVDSSAAALAAVGPEAEANGLAAARITAEEADVFQWLGQRSEP